MPEKSFPLLTTRWSGGSKQNYCIAILDLYNYSEITLLESIRIACMLEILCTTDPIEYCRRLAPNSADWISPTWPHNANAPSATKLFYGFAQPFRQVSPTRGSALGTFTRPHLPDQLCQLLETSRSKASSRHPNWMGSVPTVMIWATDHGLSMTWLMPAVEPFFRK